MAKLYALELTPYLTGGAWRALLEGLPPARRARALSCRRGEDAARIAAAGQLLRRALLRAGVPEKAQVFTENPWGRPALAGRDRPCFSLSHSGRWALCAVGEGPVGVDVELPRCTPALARRFFHPAEAAFAAALPPEEQAEALARLWVAKEAYLKAEGTGLSRPLSSFRVRLDAQGARLEQDTPLRLHEYRLEEAFVCLCTREERPALELAELPADAPR